MSLLIKNGHVISPPNDLDGNYDILIQNGIITKVAENIEAVCDEEIDAKGLYIVPGLIDMHVAIREPGYEYKETSKSATMAAACGGYTTVCALPDTLPVIDSEDMLDTIYARLSKNTVVNVLPISAITMGLGGEYIVNFNAMTEHGAISFCEGEKTVMNTSLFRKAMILASQCNTLIMDLCDDVGISRHGIINDGSKSKELNVVGIPNSAENVIVARDILLARETNARLHLMNISTAEAVEMVRIAKASGINVTCDVSVNNLLLTEDDIKGDDARFKFMPPLRKAEDVKALIDGVLDGTVDAIVSDHKPHHSSEKTSSMKIAPFGCAGLETAFSLLYTNLCEKGKLKTSDLIEKMSANPAKILEINRGRIEEKAVADFAIIDLKDSYEIRGENFYSAGKDTPYEGKTVKGRTVATFVGGTLVYHK